MSPSRVASEETEKAHGLHSPVVRVLTRENEPYWAKPAQRSSHTSPPGYIVWTIGNGTSLCRLAGLYGYSAERELADYKVRLKLPQHSSNIDRRWLLLPMVPMDYAVACCCIYMRLNWSKKHQIWYGSNRNVFSRCTVQYLWKFKSESHASRSFFWLVVS
jgi:hypothetical protein